MRESICICPWWRRIRRNAMHTGKCAQIATRVQFALEAVQADRDRYRRESAEHLSLIDGETALRLIDTPREDQP